MRANAAAALLRAFLFRCRAFCLFLLWPLTWLYRLRYRNATVVHHTPMPEATPLPLEGYTDNYWYTKGQTVTVFLKAEGANNLLVVERFVAAGEYEQVLVLEFNRTPQTTAADAAQEGCNWKPTLQFELTEKFRQGYYRVRLQDQSGKTISYLAFLVGPGKQTAPIAVIAPVCTWMAYNPYGGKSLYHNQVSREPVYFASALRSNPALQFNARENIHAWEVEANIFSWLNQHFGADLYPDYQLENPESLNSYRLLALAYHCEYVSAKMYRGLRNLVNKKQKSLLALGANQIYWQIRWHPENKRIECRKNATRFSDGSGHGSTWNKTAYPEEELLGCRFTDAGTGTYAPYQVTDAAHWLYSGCEVKPGDLFGSRGISDLPICGDETDKSTFTSRLTTQVIARGLNKAEIEKYSVFEPGSSEWNGDGGGEIAFTPLSENHAVLHTGSIQSGSGLGTDLVFTTIVRNFLNRYLTPEAEENR